MKLRNIKGFTLIELLAVILILGIIALIAVPTVNGILDDAKMESLEVTIKNLEKTVSSDCQMNILKGKDHIEKYEIIDGKSTPSINIKGKLPNTGVIEVDEKCNITIIAHDSKFCVTKSDDDITIDKTDLEMCVPIVTDEKYFTFVNGEITGYSEDGPKNVVIPETIGGVPVTSIKAYALISKRLTSVYIPDSVTTIGNGAFKKNEIKSVRLPKNLTSIGSEVFYSNKLTKVDIPNNVITIGAVAFYKNNIKEVNLPDTTTSISDYAFAFNEISKIKIPTSVVNLGIATFNNNKLPDSQAFIYARNADGTEDKTRIISYGGSRKENINIPNAVTTISKSAFQDNEIIDINIPSSVTSIDVLAFNDNKLPDSQAFIYARNADGSEDKTTLIGYGGAKKENIVIPSTVTTIDDYAFYYSEIKSITLHDLITTIGKYAFDSNLLTSIDLPQNLETIEEGSFESNNITTLSVPDSVTSIGDYAFAVNYIENLSIPGSVLTIGMGAFVNNELTSLSLGEGIKTIKLGAFTSNSLTTITIPSSVTTIEKGGFSYNRLTRINMPGRISNNLGTSWYDGHPTFNFN